MIYAAYVFEADDGESKPLHGLGLKRVDESALEEVYGVPRGSDYGKELFSIAKYLIDHVESATLRVCNVLGVYTREGRKENLPEIRADLEARTDLPFVMIH